MTPKEQATKAKIDKIGPHHTLKLLLVKGNRVKRQSMEWREIIANYISDKGISIQNV